MDGLRVFNNLATHDSYLTGRGGILESATSCNLHNNLLQIKLYSKKNHLWLIDGKGR